jgi:chemotaxis signal transduction protein
MQTMAQQERILVGTLGDVRIGIPVGDLVEVLRAPETVLGGGEIRYRGKTLAILDLEALAGTPGGDAGSRGRVLVLRGEAPLGIRVSAVEGILELDTGTIAPSARFQAPGEHFLRGLVRIGVRTILLIETEELAALAGRTGTPRERTIPE